MDTTKSIMTLVEEKLSLIKKGAVNLTHFKSLVGNLRYLKSTRPDINFIVGLISRFMKNSHQSHLQAAKRIFRYIRDTRSDGIFYSENDIVELFGYTVIGQVIQSRGRVHQVLHFSLTREYFLGVLRSSK